MTEKTSGGFTGDPAAALAVAGASGCCGSTTTIGTPVAAASGPCCGTSAEAVAEGSCCGSAAKTEAVTAGQGCCG
jgi:hypothetical protein